MHDNQKLIQLSNTGQHVSMRMETAGHSLEQINEETILMKAQDTQDSNIQQRFSEDDLPVNEERADEVKGGAGAKTVRFKPGKDLQDMA